MRVFQYFFQWSWRLLLITSSSWKTPHALSASRWHDVERVAEFYRAYDFIFKTVPRVATCVSAYAEDSSTELTDERRPPLIVRSPKNSQKGVIPCARATGDGEEKGIRYGEGVPRNKLRRNSLRTWAPPLHSTHPSPACIYFWAASFSPEGDLSCPYASSLAGCSISARRVAGNNWQSGGVATSYFRNYFGDDSWEQSFSRVMGKLVILENTDRVTYVASRIARHHHFILIR